MKFKASVVGIIMCCVFFSCVTTPHEAKPPISYTGNPALAVWDLENLSPMGAAQADLGDFLSAKIMETVRETGKFTVVERERLLLALKELELGSTNLADAATQLRIGRLAGAKLMIFGAYQVIANQMRLDLRLVEVETGRIQKAVEKTTTGTDMTAWLKAAEDAARDLM